jgi:arsenite methyltransferase
MKTIHVYDKPMCCSTGVCGPQVDAVLPRFAADLDWLRSQGHQVERFNLAQQPKAFVENAEVHQLLETQGTDCLPLIMVDGRLVSRRGCPSREMLTLWTQSTGPLEVLPVVTPATDCCGGNKCC